MIKLRLSYKYVLVIFFLWLSTTASAQTWHSGKFKVTLENGQIDVFAAHKKLVEISSIEFNFYKPLSVNVSKNSSDTLALTLVYPPKAGWRDAEGQHHARITITKVPNGIHLQSTPAWADNVSIEMNDLGDHFYGMVERLFPQQQKSPDLRGNVVNIDVHGEGALYAENHANAWSSFYISSRGYGSFFNTFVKGRYRLGIKGRNELYHRTGNLDWYLFYGPEGDKIHKAYYNITGKPRKIPFWAAGAIFWRDQNDGGKQEVLNDAKQFTKLKIPLTGLWIDRPYSNGNREWSKMDFNKKFSNPREWISTLNHTYGLKLMTWIAPMVFSKKEGSFPGLFPTYKGYFDLTNHQAVKEFGHRLHARQYAMGVQGHKLDRGDEEFPSTMRWNDGTPPAQRRNKYVWLYDKTVDQIISKATGDDHFIFARAAYNGSQHYLNAIWGGDVRTSWDGMASNLANAMRSAYMGFPVWGSDTGGYLGEGRISKKLYARWLEWGVWNGFFEVKIDGGGGHGEDRPPWKYGDQLQAIFRNACTLRMKLMPYIYSAANTSYQNGVLMKPLNLKYPKDKKTYQMWDEYMFGNAFLVAPILNPDGKRKVYLPKGQWLDFHDLTKKIQGPTTLNVHTSLEQIPVFVKANSIYVTGNLYAGNAKNWIKDFKDKRSLTIRAFAGKKGHSSTFNYVDYLDKNKQKTMKLYTGSTSITFTSPALSVGGEIRLQLPSRPQKVQLNQKKIAYRYDDETGVVSMSYRGGEDLNLKITY